MKRKSSRITIKMSEQKKKMKKVSKAKKARYLQMDKWKNDSNGSFPRHSPRNERVSHIFTLQKEEKKHAISL